MGEAAREAAAVGSYLNEWQPTRAKAATTSWNAFSAGAREKWALITRLKLRAATKRNVHFSSESLSSGSHSAPVDPVA